MNESVPAPEVCQIPHILQRDLFALNTLPFAAYVDPEWHQLERYAKPRAFHYQKYTPKALAIAHAQFRTITNKNRWGQNRSFSGISQWSTVTKEAGLRGAGGRKYPGSGLAERNLLRALTRSNVCAVGRCDADVDVDTLDLADWQTYKWPDEVSCLIGDVDMDAAWATRDAKAVWREISLEQEILRILGLPVSFATTGSRGHQFIVPMMTAIVRSAASWLAVIIASLLAHIQDPGAAVFDCTNLDGVIRVAGGRHAKNGNLSLFIDPDTLTLYPVDEQARLLSNAYRSKNREERASVAFREQMDQVAEYLHEEHGFEPGEAIERNALGREIAWNVVDAFDDNPFVDTVRDACERLGCRSSSRVVSPPSVIQPSCEPHILSGSAQARATEIWVAGYVPGGSWEWLTRGDCRGTGNGIWSAFVLFGDDAAEEELTRQSDRIGATSRSAMAERRNTIRRLCRAHLQKRGDSVSVGAVRMSADGGKSRQERPIYQDATNMITGEIPSSAQAIIEEVMERMSKERQHRETGRKAKFQDRQATLLRQMISVLAVALERQAYISISRRSLAASVQATFPDAGAINHNTVHNALEMLVEGRAACLFPLVRLSPMIRRSWNSSGVVEDDCDGPNGVSRYVAGSGLEPYYQERD